VTPYELVLPDNFVTEARESVLRELDRVKADVAGRGVTVQAHLGDAPAYVAINELAQQLEADLIVMGTRGNTGIKHVVLGSVAERTLRHAECPVLTVK
jgi:nucleotide-binding universal stress UspA family protein